MLYLIYRIAAVSIIFIMKDQMMMMDLNYLIIRKKM